MENDKMPTVSKKEQAYTRDIMIHSILRLIVCIILTLICLLPIYIIVINATRASNDIIKEGVSLIPGGSLIDNFNTLGDPDAGEGTYVVTFNLLYGYLNSLIIAVCSTVIILNFH